MTPVQPGFNGPNGAYSVCGKCGMGYGLDLKKAMGMWRGECAICGEDTGVANAYHDFGLTNAEVEAIREAVCSS
jgi:hypothetical protein